jgi:2Fe-2S ferredoxin
VRVEPSGILLDVLDGETVMGAAVRSGYRWPTVCGGQAECGVCALEVVGAAALPEPTELEATRLAELPERKLYPDRAYRLACQLRPVDGLVVRKRGVALESDIPR